MLFLLCTAMILGLSAATAIALHNEASAPKPEKARVYWQ